VSSLGCIINVLDFEHPHVRSLYEEGLWGFPDTRKGLNRKRWRALREGTPIFLYGHYRGRRGIFLKGELVGAPFEDGKPVHYWIQNPTGYPLKIRLRLDGETDPSKVAPLEKGELALAFGIPLFKPQMERWSLVVFGDDVVGATYPYFRFERLVAEFMLRNRCKIDEVKPDHEDIKKAIHQMGLIQAKVSEMEASLDGYRLDVVWKRVQRGVPYIAFEVQVGGSLNDALTKLKHAFDMWNSRPVLVTTEVDAERAKEIVSGSFHEIMNEIRIVDWRDIKKAYDLKSQYKNFESKLGLI
jgi:hypothetical protein